MNTEVSLSIQSNTSNIIGQNILSEQNLNQTEKNFQQNKNIVNQDENNNDPTDFGYLEKFSKEQNSGIQKKIKQFEITLKEIPSINIKKLQSLCFYLIPDEIKGLRSICWKLLLNYLSCDKLQWRQTIQQNMTIYQQFIEEFIIQPQKSINLTDFTFENLKKQSEVEYKYQEIWDQIEKDTKRTRADLHFFQSESQPQKFKSSKNMIITSLNYKEAIEKKIECRYDSLTRILYIYSKLNSGIKYVQGMNELVGILYFNFSHESNSFFLNSIESDVFFCFTLLMIEAKEGFIKQNDTIEFGIFKRMQELNDIFKQLDFVLWKQFEEQQINQLFYSFKYLLHKIQVMYIFRWLVLWLSQDFELHEITLIWDALLSHPNRMCFLNYICFAMIQLNRKILFNQEYATVMYNLQNLPIVEIPLLLQEAHKYYQQNIKFDDLQIPKFLNF